MRRQPWDQMRGEPDTAYHYFTCYRNMGPARTVSGAYRRERKKVTTGDPARVDQMEPSGQWYKLSRAWNWDQRAALWDVHVLQVHGTKTAVCYVMGLHNIARRCYLDSKRLRPGQPGWMEMISAMKVLGDKFDMISREPRELMEKYTDAHLDDEPVALNDAGPVRPPAEGAAALPGHDPDGAAGAAGTPPERGEDDDGIT